MMAIGRRVPTHEVVYDRPDCRDDRAGGPGPIERLRPRRRGGASTARGAIMGTRTLLKTSDRDQVLERLRRVRPDARPVWGTLDAPRMLCHLADMMRVALGDVPSKPVHSLLSRTLVKNLVVNTGFKAPRGKVQTAPEMLSSRPGSWETDLSVCVELAGRVAAGSAKAVHPAFGPLTPEEWGRLCWKHMDHHLAQFGA
jgi:hypothetical protein